jgi:hypothetical protein
MDQKEDLISQHDTLKKAYDEASSKQAYIRGKRGNLFTYRLEYYQTLINPKTKEVKDIDMDLKESE